MTVQYTLAESHGLTFVRFPHFDGIDFQIHGITTRKGGVSQGALATLNMGRRGVDMEAHLAENHRRVAEALGVSPGSFVFSAQVHGTAVRQVTRENCREPLADTDALMTNVPGITLATVYADCMPILLLDPVNRAIGMAHAGWRGAVQGIGPRLVAAMAESYGSKPQNLLAALGPAIGPCCFEIGPEVAEAFSSLGTDTECARWLHYRNGACTGDLGALNRDLLLRAGLAPEAVRSADLCTRCRADLFYSHRRDQGNTGRMAAIMAIQE